MSETESAVETLRRAAALMRERAWYATSPQDPWVVDEDRTAVRARRGAGPTVVTTIPLGHDERRANAEHIASWHPAVALAVADWLGFMADKGQVNMKPEWYLLGWDRALYIARTYLDAE